MVFTVKQQEVCVKGSLLLFLADTLAAHQIGGYKTGVGLVLCKCRNCLATSDDINEKLASRLIIIIIIICFILVLCYTVS